MTPLWRRLLIPVLALAALNLIVYGVYTLPRTVQERNVAARAAVLRTEVEREQKVVREERRQDRVLTSNAEDVVALYTRAGTKASILGVRDEVEGLAREIGFRLGPRRYQDEPVKGLPLTRFLIQMPVTGTYRQLITFLNRLERSPHMVTVDEVALRSRESGGTEAVLALSLSAYFFSGEEGDGAKTTR